MLKRTLFVTLVLTFLGSATYFILDHSPKTEEDNETISRTDMQPNSVHKKTNSNFSGSAILPTPVVTQSSLPAQALLWEDKNITSANTADIAFETQMEPVVLQQFHVGQTLLLSLPEAAEPLEAIIGTTHNQGMNVKVWKASSINTPQEGVIITQGKVETHMVIMTQGEVYTAIVDNVTGKTIVINQADKAAQTIPYEDGVQLPNNNEPLPAL